MEAHSELLVRLYAQARGRGAEFYGGSTLTPIAGCAPTAFPKPRRNGPPGKAPSSARSSSRSCAGLNAWAAEHKTELSAEAQRVLPVTVEDVYAHAFA